MWAKVKAAQVVAVGALFVLVSGCGGKQPSAIPVEDLAHTFAEAYCKGVSGCCDAAGIEFLGPDCLASMEVHYADQVALRAPKTRYDSDATLRCLSALERTLDKCSNPWLSDAGIFCRDAFVGKQQLGQACVSGECASGDCYQGQCVAELPEATPGRAGDDCDNNCAAPGHPYECPPLTPDATSSVACYASDGLLCSLDLAAVANGELRSTCLPLPGPGEPCLSSRCREGAYCDDTGACVAQHGLGPCEHYDACLPPLHCAFSEANAPDECAPPLADGEPCDNPDMCESGECLGGDDQQQLCGTTVASEAICRGLL